MLTQPHNEPSQIRAYRNVDLEISRQEKLITVRILRSHQGEDEASVTVSADLLLDLSEATSLEGLDEKIGRCLLADAVGERWAANLATAEAANEGVRLRIIVQDEMLANVLWEAAKAGGKWLGLRPQTPVVRYVPAPRPPETLLVKGPLRMLVVIGAVREAGLVGLDVEAERNYLETALCPVLESGKLELHWLEGPTTQRDFQDTLRRIKPHVLHYIGHGSYDPDKKEGYLFLTRFGSEGNLTFYSLSTQDLAILLDGSTVRFAFLNACQTGQAVGGLAYVLVKCALPAALGMRADVPDQAAAAFAGAFYRALADGLPVDAAVVEGRKLLAIQYGRGDFTWAVPVLYTRSVDGQLFELASAYVASRDANSASQGLLTMASLANTPKVRSTIAAFENDMEVACGQIKTLSAYKRVHDLLQRLEDRYRLAEESKKRLPIDPSAWISLALTEPDLTGIIEEILETTRAAPFAEDEALRMNQLEAVKTDLVTSIAEADLKALDQTLRRLDRLLASIPVQINARLVGVATSLRLPAIVRAMRSILESLPSGSTPQSSIDRLRLGADALARLSETIRSLATKHNEMQRVDDDFRYVEQSLQYDLGQLELLWPDIRAATMEIRNNGTASWALAVQEAGLQLDQALAEVNPSQARVKFGCLRSQMLRRFNQVDFDLHSVCGELQKTADPFGILLSTLQ